jgi:plastocyanin
MTATFHDKQAVSTTLALAVAAAVLGFGCNATVPGAASPPPPGVAPMGVSSMVPAHRMIAGTVVSASTSKPPVAGAVVYLEDAPKEPGAATAAWIDVDHKLFSPSIAVVTTGGTVHFGNKDALTHHVFSPQLDKWDTGYLQKNDTAGRTFTTPGAFALLCNIHPEMLGYLLVIPSSYFGHVGADGQYIITNVPPGTYKATAWSPRMIPATQAVTVGQEGAVTANFALQPEATQ